MRFRSLPHFNLPKYTPKGCKKHFHFLFFILGICFLFHVFYVTFQPSQSTYQKIAQKTFTFFFLEEGYLCFISCFLCRISTFPKYTFRGCTKHFHFLNFFWICLFMLMFMFIDVALLKRSLF